MIYKGLMGEKELSFIWGTFNLVYRFAARGQMLVQIDSRPKLADVDIEAEVFNQIMNYTIEEGDVLILTSNSSESIVTGFLIYSSTSLFDWLQEQLVTNQQFLPLIKRNAIFLLNSQDKSTKNMVSMAEKTKGSRVYSVQSRDSPYSLTTALETKAFIEAKLNDSSTGSFDLRSFSTVLNLVSDWKINSERIKYGKPVIFIEVHENFFKGTFMINTGYSKAELSKSFSMERSDLRLNTENNISAGQTRPLQLTRKFELGENFKVPTFDELVESDAQSFLLAKVRNYVKRRTGTTDDKKTNSGHYVDLREQFTNRPWMRLTFDKTYFTPSSSDKNNLYLVPTTTVNDRDVARTVESLDGLRQGYLMLNSERIQVNLGDAIRKSILAYQEIWGSYRPLSKRFFTGKQDGGNLKPEQFLRVRELFYNILYAYVDRALGGFMTQGGKRKYHPSVSIKDGEEKVEKSFPPLEEEERKLLEYLNQSDNLHSDSGEIYKNWDLFLRKFMKDKWETSRGSDNYSINLITGDAKEDTMLMLRKAGYKFSHAETSSMFLVTIVGIQGVEIDVLDYLQNNYNIKEGPALETLLIRNFYQYFIDIDTNNKGIEVIRVSMVDDPTQFSINFQDWDIRMDMTNLINQLLSKPKDLVVGDKDRAGLSKPASPAERSMTNLSHENLVRQGVVDHPLTLHYDPMKFNKVTRQKSGHLFFENTDGVLVIFPFDTFYHDVEGQSSRTIDICFTSIPHIYSAELNKSVGKELMPPFLEWVNENNKKILEIYQKTGLSRELSLYLNYTPTITPQVLKASFMRGIRNFLEDGYEFKNRSRSKAACVYVSPYQEGFYAAGDEGYRMGADVYGQKFPYDWRAFEQITEGTVSSLNTEVNVEQKGLLQYLWTNYSQNQSYKELIVQIMLQGEFGTKVPVEFTNGFGYDIREVMQRLFILFMQNAAYENDYNGLHKIVREEIKRYLKLNPEAIQVKNVARRNMSRR